MRLQIFQYFVPFLMVIGGIPFWLFSFAVIWIFAVELQILPSAGGIDMLEVLLNGNTTKAYVYQYNPTRHFANLCLYSVWYWRLGAFDARQPDYDPG